MPVRSVDERIERLRRAKGKPDLRRCAFHEASHVVIALCEGIRVTSATIKFEFGGFGLDAIDSYGRTSFDLSDCDHLDYTERLQKLARTVLAGRIGEQIANGKEPRMLRYIGSDLAEIEYAEMFLLNPVLSEETRAAWRKLQWLMVRDSLRLKWKDVQSIAAALLRQETLTSDEIWTCTRSGAAVEAGREGD
jgi:hypothetical protein